MTTDDKSLEIHTEQLMAMLALPDAGRQMVRRILGGEPVRQPQNRLGNALVKFPSRKMKRTIRLESRRGEAAQAILFEDDEDVLGYFPQPVRVDLMIKDEAGKVVGRLPHTPDFFVVRRKTLEFVENKDEAELLAKELKSSQFFRDNDQWHFKAAVTCPPISVPA